MEFQTIFKPAMIGSPEVVEARRPRGVTWTSVLDYLLATALFLAATYSFVYGNAQTRVIALIFSLVIGIVKPHLLIFSIALASSLDVQQKGFLSPMRIVIIFTSVALLFRIRSILSGFTKSHLIGLAWCSICGLWFLLCSLMRLDVDGMFNILTTVVYAVTCFMLFIVVNTKYQMPTYIWLGLAPTVVSAILATMNLRVVEKFEYLITPEGIRYRGIVNDPNYLSSVLIVGFTTCLVYLSTKKEMSNKAIYLAITAAFFFALWVSQSRGGVYAAGICMILFMVTRVGIDIKKIKFGNILLMLLIGSLAVVFVMNSTKSRIFSVWRHEGGVTVVRGYTQEALMDTLENPVFGLGETNFVKRYGVAPHNTMLSIGLEYGVIGLCLVLVGIFYGFFNIWRYRKQGSMIYCLPFLALNVVLCSFSAPGHKLLWFYLVGAAVFHERALCNDETNLATCSQ